MMNPRLICYWATIAFGLAIVVSHAEASLYGTMSNFDVYNETETEAHGAEIELEGIHPEDLSRTFPSHFNSKTISGYTDGANFGTRVIYTDYNFNSLGYLAPTMGQSTNGHACVNTPGCEHFGFSTVGIQPTAAHYYWLDQNGNRINNAAMQVPTPSWTYIPPVGGGAPILRAEVEPVEVHPQQPDSVWMKVFKTELDRPVELAELMSANDVVPEDAAETETEWELLEGGKMDQVEDEVPEGKQAVIRRYEFYEYTGAYDPEEHEPLTNWNGDTDPPADELGQFISANMVAANLEAPARTLGDYNGDGLVNTADYVTWRMLRGNDDEYRADGNDDGHIDVNDYDVWINSYGDVLEGGGHGGAGPGGAGAVIPEPAACGLALLGTTILATCRAHRRSTCRSSQLD